MKAILIIAAILVFIIFIYIVSTYNYFKTQKQEIEHSRSNIEVALTNRYDVLVKINKTVSAYAGHETETLTNIIKLRKGMSTEELNKASEQMDQAFSNISVIAENYPDLRSSENFLHLQESIFDVENTIQATRRIFNRDVADYNGKVQSFPSNLIANAAKAVVEPYFEAEQKKIQDVELQF